MVSSLELVSDSTTRQSKLLPNVGGRRNPDEAIETDVQQQQIGQVRQVVREGAREAVVEEVRGRGGAAAEV